MSDLLRIAPAANRGPGQLRLRLSLAVLLLVVCCPDLLCASVVVLSNRTDKELSLEFASDTATWTDTLQPSQAKAVRATGPLTVNSKQLAGRYILDPLGVYYIATNDHEEMVVGRIEIPLREDLKQPALKAGSPRSNEIDHRRYPGKTLRR